MHLKSTQTEIKEKLRKFLKDTRSKILDRDKKSEQISSSLLKLLNHELKIEPNKTHILAYSSINSEVSTDRLLTELLELELKLYMPYCDQNMIVPLRILDLAMEMKSGSFNILEPTSQIVNDPNRKIALEDIDIILVPGLGFDKQGNRLGLGKGFYDRFLPLCKKSIKIGLAFDEQIVELIPTDHFDQKVDIIVTESMIIKPN